MQESRNEKKLYISKCLIGLQSLQVQRKESVVEVVTDGFGGEM